MVIVVAAVIAVVYAWSQITASDRSSEVEPGGFSTSSLQRMPMASGGQDTTIPRADDTADRGTAPNRVTQRPLRPRATPPRMGGSTGPRGPQRRSLVIAAAAVAVVVVIGVIIGVATRTSVTTSAPVATATAAPAANGSGTANGALAPFVPMAGLPLTVARRLGNGALSQPQAVLALPSGDLAVADTGHARVVLLDANGHLTGYIAAPVVPFLAPFALHSAPNGFYVLDAKRAAIYHLDRAGRLLGTVAKGPFLSNARDMAIGADGRVYVVNPLTNSLTELDAHGHQLQTVGGALGSGLGEFNQPSAVAVGADGTIFVYDNGNRRIQLFNHALTATAQWAAPASDTSTSVHLLTLDHGRLLASDPSGGALIVYTAKGVAMRYPLPGGKPTQPAFALGLAKLSGDRVAVADWRGNRVVLTSIPQ